MLTILLLSFLAISCSTNNYIEKTIPGKTIIAFLDFKPFLDKGFVFSTGDINQNYSPLGVISFLIEPDITKTYKKFHSVVMQSMIDDGALITENDQEYLLYKTNPNQNSNAGNLLQKVHEYAISRGANGMINLKYIKLEIEAIEISGTLIKII